MATTTVIQVRGVPTIRPQGPTSPRDNPAARSVRRSLDTVLGRTMSCTSPVYLKNDIYIYTRIITYIYILYYKYIKKYIIV